MQDLSNIQQPLMGNIEALRGRKDPEAIKAAAKEMESLFAYELLKVMRETTDPATKSSFGSDTYMSMFDMELSKLLASRGLGLSEMLTKGLAARAEKNGSDQTRPEPVDNQQERSQETKIKALLLGNGASQISSGYGMRHDPVNGDLRFHEGVDIAALEGTDVHPVKPGTVIFSGEKSGYGNVVIVDHGNSMTTTYAHNQVNLVQAGDIVEAGSVIARVGSSGRSTGPHVHFELAYDGQKVNPGRALL
jgi:murein DD-endopeptidase MepM/ murein hydrolase activator NlpD